MLLTMMLFVGLGNPGLQFQCNRHNIGFMVIDKIFDLYHFSPWETHYPSIISEGIIAGKQIIILKPMTFMNQSGYSLSKAVRYFNLFSEDVSVFYDELDLSPGKVRLKRGGGSGGHKGISNINQHIKNNYRRIRLGIGHPGDKNKVNNYVLSNFSKEEKNAWLTTLVDTVANEIDMLMRDEEINFMNKVSNAVFSRLIKLTDFRIK
ncbi:peptidyl-tRNA hydrolase [Candidatus Endolissoclinum faulkneri L5]|uniref:Peptidyl-tRNA hydrolase n=1 Tax=Candidatus Endolissoclinum faulkneri L5 TaxID=1401328 RepID=V9TQX0_9PROT|nr:aminoacyl-tRNA hydrolase [Candidatus Endolissoclinum faulkneri]AHC73274.1 peptidyl-tRNA hydrolase [Candidatus Endolissoclinum faulkneri L5]